VYGTYLGGGRDDVAESIALDSSNNAYITGRTNSTDFPLLLFRPLCTAAATLLSQKSIRRVQPCCIQPYLGGGNDETTAGIWGEEMPTCAGITVNSNGNAYVTGVTASPDFPQVRSTQGFRGITDAYIVEFSTDGKSLVYSTLLGGAVGGDINDQPKPSTAFSSGSAVAYLNGNLYVAGLTLGAIFP
jgi:hypothetical protein